MPQNTTFCCPEFSSQKLFTSDSWPLIHIKLHYPEHLQVAQLKNVTIRSAPYCGAPAQHCEGNPNEDSVKDFEAVPYLEYVETIGGSESLPPPPPLPRMETNPSAGALLSNYITELWECDALCHLETNLQYHPYYPFVTRDQYKYIHHAIKKMAWRCTMKMCCRKKSPLCILQPSKMGMASRSLWLACHIIRLSGSGNYTLLRIWDGMTITNALSNTGVEISSVAWDSGGGSQPTPRISYTPVSVALTAIRHQNTSIPKCTLPTGGGRHM